MRRIGPIEPELLDPSERRRWRSSIRSWSRNCSAITASRTSVTSSVRARARVLGLGGCPGRDSVHNQCSRIASGVASGSACASPERLQHPLHARPPCLAIIDATASIPSGLENRLATNPSSPRRSSRSASALEGTITPRQKGGSGRSVRKVERHSSPGRAPGTGRTDDVRARETGPRDRRGRGRPAGFRSQARRRS